MSGVLQHQIPELFTCLDKSGKVFRCSETVTRAFLHRHLGWSARKATRAAQKYPPNVNTVLLHAFLRFACTVRDESIPACCIVNADQTQVVYNSSSHTTWASTGERQVHVLGLEEKRAFTLLVAASLSGDVLPLQAIYSGKTARSLPNSTAAGVARAVSLGFVFDYSETSNYWSTDKTMRRFITKVLAPYFIAQRLCYNLPATQRCILQIDCWSVHRSAKFRSWMATTYPWIILLYVAGGCTGLFQACDVGLQRILKLAIWHASHADVVNETVVALEAGTAPQDILNNQS
ncbi:hypothetical protein BDV93DRAFT_444485 [Ceratobasidium sp. AG-I]|nr:hypothetical protein BDV93DRAFT_444485 [Ceratobasidium sp. AG-I]